MYIRESPKEAFLVAGILPANNLIHPPLYRYFCYFTESGFGDFPNHDSPRAKREIKIPCRITSLWMLHIIFQSVKEL